MENTVLETRNTKVFMVDSVVGKIGMEHIIIRF